MSLKARLKRLTQQACRSRTTGPPVTLYLPANGRGEPARGEYPCPGSRAVMVIYEAESEPRESTGVTGPFAAGSVGLGPEWDTNFADPSSAHSPQIIGS
jgi:hypothetical protein